MRQNDFHNQQSSRAARRRAANGFSLVELLTVMTVSVILVAIAVPLMFRRHGYQTEDQAMRVSDMMREAAQLALTRKRFFRFEIDLTQNRMRIVDENQAGAADDRQIKSVPLAATADVRVNTNPNTVAAPNPPNYPNAVFAVDNIGHLNENGTRVQGNSVWAIRFRADGAVLTAGGALVSATLFVWAPAAPNSPNARNAGEIRAITVFGGSGAVRLWRRNANNTAFVAA